MAEQRTIPVDPDLRDRVRKLKGDKTYREIISEWADRYANENISDRHRESP